MNYYPFHLGDYASHTGHLEPMEDLAYRRLLDAYYLRECQLPSDPVEAARLIRMRNNTTEVEAVLKEFFLLAETGWSHARCDEEILKMQDKQAKARSSAQASVNARKAKANQPQSEWQADAERTLSERSTDVQLPTPTPTPTPLLKKQRGSRLPQDFLLSKEWADFCTQQRPDLNLQNTFDSFKDFWVAKAGAGGVKLDWLATWRNWVRNQSVPKASFAQTDIARTTVPRNQAYEDTQRRLREEADRNCTGPSLEVLAKMAALRNGVKENHES